jgi:hypothetical protein
MLFVGAGGCSVPFISFVTSFVLQCSYLGGLVAFLSLAVERVSCYYSNMSSCVQESE